jgi:hypothetical protein
MLRLLGKLLCQLGVILSAHVMERDGSVEGAGETGEGRHREDPVCDDAGFRQDERLLAERRVLAVVVALEVNSMVRGTLDGW